MLRWQTFRIILVTSIIWISLGFGFLVFYTDCIGGDGVNCVGGKQRKVHSNSNDMNDNKFKAMFRSNNEPPPNLSDSATAAQIHASILSPYISSQLHAWTPVVFHNNPSSWPGENGKGVVIPKEEEALKNEKFKLNQFNLLASDKIALNRSLPDVRMDQYVSLEPLLLLVSNTKDTNPFSFLYSMTWKLMMSFFFDALVLLYHAFQVQKEDLS